MVIIGGLRLITGLVFLGMVIASCLWFLNRLFPDTSSTPHHSRNHTSRITLPAQQKTAAGEHRQHATPGVTQEPGPPNGGEVQDERIAR
jgi:hypothetical protein